MTITTDLLTVARKLNNYEKDATGGGLFTDTTHYRVTVAVGKRWFIIGGMAQPDVSGTMVGKLYDSADNEIAMILEEGAGTARVAYPEASFQTGHLWILDTAEYFEILFGAIQGAGAWVSCIVLEVDA